MSRMTFQSFAMLSFLMQFSSFVIVYFFSGVIQTSLVFILLSLNHVAFLFSCMSAIKTQKVVLKRESPSQKNQIKWKYSQAVLIIYSNSVLAYHLWLKKWDQNVYFSPSLSLSLSLVNFNMQIEWRHRRTAPNHPSKLLTHFLIFVFISTLQFRNTISCQNQSV